MQDKVCILSSSAFSVRLRGAVRFRDQLRGRTEFGIFLCYRGQHILEGNLLQSLEYVVHFSSNVQSTCNKFTSSY